MLQFSDWFTREYKQWCQSQHGEEDFLAFCELLGYSPSIILSWLQGDSTPQDAEILSVAGMFGTKVYSLLGQPEPDVELLKIYNSFSHLTGEYRKNLSLALYEAELSLKEKKLSIKSIQAKEIFNAIFSKYGFPGLKQ